MISKLKLKLNLIKEKLGFMADTLFSMGILCKIVLIFSFVMQLFFILAFYHSNYPASESSHIRCKDSSYPFQSNYIDSNDHPTNISHLVFGLFGSEKAWRRRKVYIESWWRPNMSRGYIYLDESPRGNLLPWSSSSPPYRVSDNYFTKLLVELEHLDPVPTRIVHGIMEVFRVENGNLRWLVIGDDDSIFLIDNLVDVLSEYDHTKFYYFGGQSEFILSNFYLSFEQGFGGGGLILSYPLAKALTRDMENCLRRYASLKFSDQIIMKCIADIGVNLSPHKGIHQIDLRGDISGFLGAHPQAPLISLHHLDAVKPIFPSKNRYESAVHLMKAASLDQSRMLQQTICHHRQNNWSISIAWGYSVQLYETIMPRSLLQLPLETFRTWLRQRRPPHYMFNTRTLLNHSCETPHVFFLESAGKTSSSEIRAVYSRANPRGLPACSLNGNYSADYVSRVEVLSPTTKQIESGRCECCDIVSDVIGLETAKVKLRECREDEIIA